MNWSSLNTKPKILVGLAMPLALLVILGGIAINSIGKLNTTSGWVNHTYNVLGNASDIVASAVDMETGMRGYLLAGKEEFLEPYNNGEKAAYERIAALQKTVSDNPGQVERLGEVEKTLREWQSTVTEPAIALRRQIGDAKTMNDMAALVGEAKGKTYFDKFRGQIATFIEREQVLLEQRERDFERLLSSISVDSATAKQTIGWVTHTYKVIGHANDIVAAAVDMETGMRGFLLAGKEEFLDPYKGGSDQFFKLTAALRETVNDNPAQVQLLSEVDETIRGWQNDVTEPMIALRRQIGDSKTMDDMADLIGEARGKVYFDKFRGLMGEFSAEEAGLMEVRKQENVATEKTADMLIIGGIIVGLILGGGAGLIIGNGIAGPIIQMTSAMGRLADGDKSIDIPGRERGDEVGAMANAVQVFKENMIKADEMTVKANEMAAREAEEAKVRDARAQKIETLTQQFDTGVSELLSAVSGAATEMESTASAMGGIADETNQRSTTVAAAAEQASANVQTVATASEELSSSIQEISRQVTQSSQIASRAVEQANQADRQVQGLTEAATQIGEVIGLISDIAEQTNLLALNATIEAARAGDAGKGFAVVASEVKNLANQTAKATGDISQQVSGIQAETANAVTGIQSISSTINDLNEIAAAIASAVEEQGAATGEIARNVEEASTGTQDVTTNIIEVTRAAGETRSASEQVTDVARDLNVKADNLKGQVERFLSGVREA